MSEEHALIAGMLHADIRNAREQLKTTVLHWPGGFIQEEIDVLVNGLMTEVKYHPKHPNTLVLWGHHTADRVIGLLGHRLSGVLTCNQATGVDALPFFPTGWVR